jgi:hypothetical protein
MDGYDFSTTSRPWIGTVVPGAYDWVARADLGSSGSPLLRDPARLVLHHHRV